MSIMTDSSQIQSIIQEVDRLIAEMNTLRSQIIALSNQTTVQPYHSIREAEYFGMWADREDMRDHTTREWLEILRTQQWTRS